MAQVTGLFASYKLAMLGSGPHGAVDLDADTINLVLVSIDDTPVLATDQDLADITSGERVSTVTLGTKTTTAGTFDSADPTWTAVSGDHVDNAVMYDNTPATDATRPLIGSWGFAEVTPNGGNIIGTVNASGWFSV